jgi:arylsulfatase A-like enzyme
MSPAFEDAKARQQIRKMVDPYRNAEDKEDYEYYKSVSQVDLVPTLSLLMGLPIPKNSVGQLIPELFSDLSGIHGVPTLHRYLNAPTTAFTSNRLTDIFNFLL